MTKPKNKIVIEPDGRVWVEIDEKEIGLGDIGVDVEIYTAEYNSCDKKTKVIKNKNL